MSNFDRQNIARGAMIGAALGSGAFTAGYLCLVAAQSIHTGHTLVTLLVNPTRAPEDINLPLGIVAVVILGAIIGTPAGVGVSMYRQGQARLGSLTCFGGGAWVAFLWWLPVLFQIAASMNTGRWSNLLPGVLYGLEFGGPLVALGILLRIMGRQHAR